jgi:hypothetical protein
MGVASQIAKKVVQATEPTGEEDLKTLKSLARKVNAARKAERRAENLSENSPEKLRLKRAEEKYDAFVQESKGRSDRRFKEIMKWSDDEFERFKGGEDVPPNFSKGGMVKKKKVSRSNSLNKFYGK